MLVVLLANIMLVIVTSHSRLTQHQLGRIQAYYAGQAAMYYALEMVRLGSPPAGWGVGTHFVEDQNFPAIIKGEGQDKRIRVDVTAAGSPGCDSPPAPAGGYCIDVNVTYLTPQLD
jgi:hypothetical protein